MSNFDKFIEEIKSLEVRISKHDGLYTLEQYTQFAPDYESRLTLISEHALTELINMTGEQIKGQISRLKSIEQNFNEIHTYFNSQFSAYYSGNGFNSEDFIYKIFRFFAVTFPDGKAGDKITPLFMQCLADAIMFKHGALSGFICQVKNIQPIVTDTSDTKKDYPPHSEKQPIEPPLETKEQQVRTILQPLFNDCGEHQFNSLIEHITAKKRPTYKPVIKFSGVKTNLYRKLMLVVDLGFTRQHLASVFSDICGMDYATLNKKISHTA